MSHFFSRIRLAARQPDQLLKILKANEYRFHQLLWEFFPGEPDARRDFLYRRDEQNGWPVFYLLSAREPRAFSDVLEIDTKTFDPKLKVGDRLAFCLRANPVHTRKTADASSKKRIRDDVVMHLKKQLGEQGLNLPSKAELTQRAGQEWLEQRARKSGFAIDVVQADCYQQHHIRRRDLQIKFSSVDFQGTLSVETPQDFLRSLLYGIGPAKAFGCGLMMVRRINNLARFGEMRDIL